MLRIGRHEMGQGGCVLRLEGRLVGPWVEELRRASEGALATSTSLALDLTEVSFIDRAGVALIRGLRGRGAAIINCSGFLTEQLKG